MEGKEFAKQLGTWIWPGVLAEAAAEMRDEPKASSEPVNLYLCSEVLSSGEEAGLADLVQLYLDNFFVPGPVLDVARLFWHTYFEDHDTVSKIREASFHGALYRDFEPPRAATSARPVLLLQSTCFEIRLVDLPLTMLANLVSDLARNMRIIRQRIGSPGAVHQELTHDGPLAVFVEARVTFGVSAKAAWPTRSCASQARPGGDRFMGQGHRVRLTWMGFSCLPTWLKTRPSPVIRTPGMNPDRFRQVAAATLQNGADLNIQASRNEYSVFMRPQVMDPTPPGTVLIDELYGLAYDRIPAGKAAIYGVTDAMPNADLDGSATRGFLRIPFARIPRFDVHNLQQLNSLIDQLPRRAKASPLLFRGQTCEHLIGRSAETLLALYGDPGALDPSLVPSGVRAKFDFDAVAPEWTAVVGGILETAVIQLDHAKHGDIYRGFIAYRTHYLFRRFAAAVAQHYWLPSSGLDVTTKLDVALFFALRKFVPDDAGEAPAVRCMPLEREGTAPVLYVLEPYPARVESDFGKETPSWIPLTRPQRQAAHFIHRGWGMSQNDAARWILGAFYLDPAGDFGPLPSAAFLFPPPEQDMFDASLDGLRRTKIGKLLPELGRFLAFFRAVKEDGN